jgi:TetR/AcrR family transcriptional regulator, mexCD-oprJ operon repressor
MMHLVMNRPSARLRTPAAILETAAHVLAERPDASVADIAAAAGVGRATLYRYFPTREALLDALAAEAVQELAARIADAALDRVPVPEALQRLLRAFLTVSDRYVVLFRERVKPQREAREVQRLIGAPVLAVFQRGVDDGVLRDDLDADVLLGLFAGLVLAAVEADLPRTLGVEQTAASVASLFLDGARRRP